MKRILLILALLTLIGVITRCKTGLNESSYSIGFVSSYVIPSSMTCLPQTYSQPHYIFIQVNGRGFSYSNSKSDYVALAEKYGDTNYKGYVLPGSSVALAIEAHGITVVCDKDINSSHPAGTPLDDIIRIVGYTYSEYINSNYTYYTSKITDNSLDYPISVTGKTGYTPFCKLLKDITWQDLVLLSFQFNLYLPKDWPTGDYNLTITMFFDDFELSETVTYIVE